MIPTALTVVLVVLALVVGALVGWLLSAARSAASLRSTDVRAERLAAELESAAIRHADRTRDLEAAREAMSARFGSLAAEALAANNAQFLSLAEQRLRTAQVAGRADLAEREAAVRTMVEPLSKTLDRVAEELLTAEKARLASAAALEEQLRAMRESSEALRGQTGDLVTALRSSQVRGAWGELQLRRVVEAAGMLRHVDFVEQDHIRTDDGALRPDMVVRLAGGKHVVVDAKVAFLAYLDAQQAKEPAVRAERLAAHARHFRAHVDSLAAKQYWERLSPAPEFVVMFVPAEAFLSAALEQDPALLEHAFARNVVIATPTTLVALLRTVGYAWRQDALAQNAQQVLTLGKELHGRLATMGEHLTKLGRQIDGAAVAYNRTVASLETRVLVSARRFADLEVVDKTLESPPTAGTQLVRLSAPELLAGDDSGERGEIRFEASDGTRSEPSDLARFDRSDLSRLGRSDGEAFDTTAQIQELVEMEVRRVAQSGEQAADRGRSTGLRGDRAG